MCTKYEKIEKKTGKYQCFLLTVKRQQSHTHTHEHTRRNEENSLLNSSTCSPVVVSFFAYTEHWRAHRRRLNVCVGIFSSLVRQRARRKKTFERLRQRTSRCTKKPTTERHKKSTSSAVTWFLFSVWTHSKQTHFSLTMSPRIRRTRSFKFVGVEHKDSAQIVSYSFRIFLFWGLCVFFRSVIFVILNFFFCFSYFSWFRFFEVPHLVSCERNLFVFRRWEIDDAMNYVSIVKFDKWNEVRLTKNDDWQWNFMTEKKRACGQLRKTSNVSNIFVINLLCFSKNRVVRLSLSVAFGVATLEVGMNFKPKELLMCETKMNIKCFSSTFFYSLFRVSFWHSQAFSLLLTFDCISGPNKRNETKERRTRLSVL